MSLTVDGAIVQPTLYVYTVHGKRGRVDALVFEEEDGTRYWRVMHEDGTSPALTGAEMSVAVHHEWSGSGSSTATQRLTDQADYGAQRSPSPAGEH